MHDLFDVPGTCEGCDRAEMTERQGHDGRMYKDKAYISWMPLLSAYICKTCLEAYSRWATNPVEDDDVDWNNRKPACVTAIEEKRKKEASLG